MEKTFPIIVIVVAIIGFSSSAYFFSESDISIESPISIETKNNDSLMNDIEACIEQNLVGDTVSLNSFNTNMLLTLKEAASEAQTDEELNQIKEKLYSLTDCKP